MQCKRCVMDNLSDPTIMFDNEGHCNYCSDALRAKEVVYFPNDIGKKKLEKFFDDLKAKRMKEKYDCMLGLSGGLDSSYAAYIGHTYGLRMLAVHIDDGFDTPVTTANINKICNKFSIDLIIEKPDPVLFADLTKAFIRAGVPNIAIPQDNVLFACLYKYAKENKIDCFLNGGNFALESILQKGNTYDASDKKHILSIWKRFGEKYDPANLPLFSVFEKKFVYQYLNRITFFRPLNFLDYNAKNAFETLNKSCGFEYYGDKHCESIFTKFMQRYYLPTKFGVDKRKSHYSSMIVSGQMTRPEAIQRLQEPLYSEYDLNCDLRYVLDKLQMDREEFDKILWEVPKAHEDYTKSKINIVNKYFLKLRKTIMKH
jgi:N-acetyl sugar amidotransferase